MSEILEERGDYRVRLEDDQDCQDPRDDNDLVEIVTPELQRWTVRTENARLQDAFDRLTQYRGGDEAFVRYAKIFHGITVYAVWMYEHSAVALSVQSFVGRAHHAQWDSGQIGFAYILPEQRWEGIDEEKAISSTVEELGQWINGETYGYIVEKKTYWSKEYADPDRADEEGWDWEEEDSCWGFIGMEWAEQAAMEELDRHAPKEAA